MNDRLVYKEHFEMLELPLEADFAEVHKAWQLLKEIYSTDSLATISLTGELSEEERCRLLAGIETSYQVLTSFFHERRHRLRDQVQELAAAITDYDGAALRRIREQLAIPLDDVAMATRVPRRHLENIEKDNYGALPVPVYTRGFVVNYAKHLSLDAEKVAESFMERFRSWLEKKKQ
jgi:hypothetical protein